MNLKLLAYQVPLLHDCFLLLAAHPDEFVYLNQGGAATIDGVDDAKSFQEMVAALSLLGFGPKEQNDMWRVLAAVLHLGNVHLASQAEGTTISVSPRSKLFMF